MRHLVLTSETADFQVQGIQTRRRFLIGLQDRFEVTVAIQAFHHLHDLQHYLPGFLVERADALNQFDHGRLCVLGHLLKQSQRFEKCHVFPHGVVVSRQWLRTVSYNGRRDILHGSPHDDFRLNTRLGEGSAATVDSP